MKKNKNEDYTIREMMSVIYNTSNFHVSKLK